MTIGEYIKQLPEYIYKKALSETIALEGKDKLNEPCISLDSAVANMFYWDQSVYGFDYWNDLHNQLLNKL